LSAAFFRGGRCRDSTSLPTRGRCTQQRCIFRASRWPHRTGRAIAHAKNHQRKRVVDYS